MHLTHLFFSLFLLAIPLLFQVQAQAMPEEATSLLINGHDQELINRYDHAEAGRLRVNFEARNLSNITVQIKNKDHNQNWTLPPVP